MQMQTGPPSLQQLCVRLLGCWADASVVNCGKIAWVGAGAALTSLADATNAMAGQNVVFQAELVYICSLADCLAHIILQSLLYHEMVAILCCDCYMKSSQEDPWRSHQCDSLVRRHQRHGHQRRGQNVVFEAELVRTWLRWLVALHMFVLPLLGTVEVLFILPCGHMHTKHKLPLLTPPTPWRGKMCVPGRTGMYMCFHGRGPACKIMGL